MSAVRWRLLEVLEFITAAKEDGWVKNRRLVFVSRDATVFVVNLTDMRLHDEDSVSLSLSHWEINLFSHSGVTKSGLMLAS